jgi:hypothetical protein
MTVTELPATATPLPDAAIVSPGDDAPLSAAPAADGSAPIGFGALLDALNAGGAQLERAEGAENAYISGAGSLQDMVFERAKADSLVSVAAAASSRMAQSLNTLAQIQL